MKEKSKKHEQVFEPRADPSWHGGVGSEEPPLSIGPGRIAVR